MADDTLITLTADIVVAHLGHNAVAADQIVRLIETVYASLDSLGKPTPVVEAKAEPAISIRSSVKADAITCLECGKRLKTLRRHLGADHGLTPDQYRQRWGLPKDYPMVAPEYAKRRSAMAVELGLGRKPAPQAKPARRGRAAKADANAGG